MLFPVNFITLLTTVAAIKFKSPPPLEPIDLPVFTTVEQCVPRILTTVLTRYSVSPVFEKITSYFHEPAMTYHVEKVLLSTVTETLTVQMTSKGSVLVSKYTSTVFSPTFTTVIVPIEPTRYDLRTSRLLVTRTEVLSVTLTEPRIETVEITSTVTSYDRVEAFPANGEELQVVTVTITSSSEAFYDFTVTVTENLNELVYVTLTVPVSRVCSAMTETTIYETLPITTVSYIVRTRTETFTYRPADPVQDHKNVAGLYVEGTKGPLSGGLFVEEYKGGVSGGAYVEGNKGGLGGNKKGGLEGHKGGLGGEVKKTGILMSVIDDFKKNFQKS